MKNKKAGLTIVELIMCSIPIAGVLAGIVLLCCVVKGCNYICDNGVKNVLERAWSGVEEKPLTPSQK